MRTQQRRRRSLHLEFLERRETPSTFTGRPSIVHRLAALQQQSLFIGKGCGAGTSAAQQSDGSLLLMASVNGFAVALGHYTGEFRITVPNDGSSIVVQARLQNQAEATLRLTITLMPAPVSGNPESNGPQEYQGTFLITGGTGRFATATGEGDTLVMVMQQGRSFSFRLDGMITF
jgi:hypothetical protein